MLVQAAQQALGRNPRKALEAVRRLRRELERVEEAQVANALAAGWSWARIGRALGVSRQAVHRKYASCEPARAGFPDAARFSNAARLALVMARAEAAARGDVLVGTEHILLGLMLQGEGCSPPALRNAGASLKQLRAAADALAPSDLYRLSPSRIGMSAHAEAAVSHALRAASSAAQKDGRVEDHNLLLAVLESPEYGARRVLEAAGVSAVDVVMACHALVKRNRGEPVAA